MKRGHLPPIAPGSSNRLHFTVKSGESELYRRLFSNSHYGSPNPRRVPSPGVPIWSIMRIGGVYYSRPEEAVHSTENSEAR
jgi:hypothetical protein